MNSFAEMGIAVDAHGRAEQRVPCPQCAKRQRDDALGVNIETGAFHCFRCGWKGKLGTESGPMQRVTRINDAEVAARKRDRLRGICAESCHLEHAKAYAVCRYLESRALGAILKNPPRVLRAHPALEYWDGTRSLGRYPAMIAILRAPSGDPVTLHATYLRADGCAKAAVPAPKKILGVPQRGATKGGAIRLYEPRGGVLGIAEGIETALSLHLIRNVPVWASFCANNLAGIRLPERLRKLEIAVDLDASGKGREVAEALARRMRRVSPQTRTVYIFPELEGPTGDLNDELRRRAG
jgi:hypothetical protein